VAAILFFVAAANVWAHDLSAARIRLALQSGGADGEWTVAVPDLQRVLELDGNGDGTITWGELRSSKPQLQSLLNRSLHLQPLSANCHHSLQELLVEQSPARNFAVLRFSSSCDGVGAAQALEYRFLADIDALHLASYQISSGDKQLSGTLSSEASQVAFATATPRSIPTTMVVQGVKHIALGIDHLLFLLVILLPLFRVDRSTGKPALPANTILRRVGAYTLTFTLAHSITLALAAANLIRLPPEWVEVIIALTVAYGAWNAAGSRPRPVPLGLLFAFGLIHGLGFASALQALLGEQPLVGALLGFNLGVELGQLLFVLLVAPLFYWGGFAYGGRLRPVAALLVLCVSLVWIAERSRLLLGLS
tara:strand:- start:78826 stop:79917 length:1092 start_codon:yes stop_codon:yes gene_type:complete